MRVEYRVAVVGVDGQHLVARGQRIIDGADGMVAKPVERARTVGVTSPPFPRKQVPLREAIEHVRKILDQLERDLLPDQPAWIATMQTFSNSAPRSGVLDMTLPRGLLVNLVTSQTSDFDGRNVRIDKV